jgi:hypothetical protein
MNILTFFDPRKISDGWRERIDKVFSTNPNAKITHAESLQDLSLRSGQGDGDVLIFGFSDGRSGSWTQIFPFIGERRVPVMLTGELDKDYFRHTFHEHTGQTLETIDTVQFYGELEGMLARIEARHAHHMGERKE